MANARRQSRLEPVKTLKEGVMGVSMGRDDLFSFLSHVHRMDYAEKRFSRMIRPVCIWGQAGIGKTEIVMDYARSRGWDFAYCAPAQFEEMGDFHGMPVVEEGRTTYARPTWVPVSQGRPGILLLDDFNRADDRILKGLMQLFQNHGLMSWNMPADWHIVCTANPDKSDYSVTRLDEAMSTRMLHVTLEFDHKAWADWALDNGIDSRGVDFVLMYPETVLGRLTNPRTLTTFFRHTADIADLSQQQRLVEAIGSSLLDRETVTAFINYIRRDMLAIPAAESLLDACPPGSFESHVKALVCREDLLRLDILGTLATRLIHLATKEPMSDLRYGNLLHFCEMEWLPNDIRTTLVMSLPQEISLRLASERRIAERLVS